MSLFVAADTSSCVRQGTERLFQLGILFNRAEAESFRGKMKGAAMRPPVSSISLLLSPGSDSSNDMDANDDIFEP